MKARTEGLALGRGGWSLGAALIAGGALALTAVLTLAAPQGSFYHGRTNLSRAPTYESNVADIAISPDGDRVVVVWPQSISTDPDEPAYGSVLLRWASESTGGGWNPSLGGDPMEVFAGTSLECATAAAVAVTGTNPYTAHVAYVVQGECGNPTQDRVLYSTCRLESGWSCGSSVEVTSTLLAVNDWGFEGVDITLDDQGKPHIAYTYFRWSDSASADVGVVSYAWLSGGGFPTHVTVSGDVSGCDGPGKPSIAWARGVVNDYAHVVWEDDSVGCEEIFYSRGEAGSTTTWNRSNPLDNQGEAEEEVPRNPDIVARGSRVVVVWDRYYCPDSPCEDFTLAYKRDENDGTNMILSSFPWLEVITNTQSGKNLHYTSTDAFIMWAETLYLQPSVALDGEGLPTVVWHVNQGTQSAPDYDIYYTQGLSETTVAGLIPAFTWSDAEVFGESTGGQWGSPVVATASVISPELHLAYSWSDMWQAGQAWDWETYYDSPASEDYPNVYIPLVLRSFSG